MAPLASEAWKLPNRICPPQTLHKPLLGCTSKFPVEVVIPTAKILSPHLFLKLSIINLRKSRYNFHFTVSYV